jgi:hypothetical protein
MGMEVDLVLLNGERRTFVVPGHTGSVASVLDRLDEWVQTQDGGWVQKKFIVEVRVGTLERDSAVPRGSDEEFHQLSDAADSLADQADE